MNIALKILIGIFVLLAISSGFTKVMLMPQDVEFFGKYGFNGPMVITYGAAQIVGGVAMTIPSLRGYGALIVALTFLISLVLLVVDGKYLVATITVIATAFLVLIFVQSKTHNKSLQSTANDSRG